jgi:hypothetical protein
MDHYPSEYIPFTRTVRTFTLLSALALALTRSAGAEKELAAIPFSQIGAKATADYHGDALAITATAEGVRLKCGFQKLEGRATVEGLWLESSATGGGRFRVAACAVGRAQDITDGAQGARAEGTLENSPAFQRWDQGGQETSREAAAELAPRLGRSGLAR